MIEDEQAIGKVVVPGAHEVSCQLDAVGGFEFPLLAVEGAVIAELLGEEVGTEGWGEDDVFACEGGEGGEADRDWG